MILQALYEYYLRKSADPDAKMGVTGWDWKEISFILVLNTEGRLVAIDDMRDKKRAKSYLLPKEKIRPGSQIVPNILWDKPSYLWGYDPASNKPERLQKQCESFVAAVRTLPQEDAGIKAVLLYFADAEAALAQAQQFFESWQMIAETLPFIALRLDGDVDEYRRNVLICRRPAVIKAINALQSSGEAQFGVCLVTGDYTLIERTHAKIKNINNPEPNLVAFNADAFCSYGKEQGQNAPVSQSAADGYTKALNYLLNKDSNQKFRLGNTTTVFWARKPVWLEAEINELIAGAGEGREQLIQELYQLDDPDKGTGAIKTLLNSPHQGGGARLDEENPFYILGLSPNAARLSVRFWLPTTADRVKDGLRQYFNEIALVAKDKPLHPRLKAALRTLALEGDIQKHLSPLLEGQMLQSIFSGARYPQTLLATALRRMAAERNLPHLRAALIKAYLIRNCNKEIPMSLNENHPDEAYHLGRLFAVLEKTQEEAMPGINATIRDRYFGAASTRPATVFSNLVKLHIHHLGKLENRGRAVNLERLVTDIVSRLSGYPSTLSLENQGLFSIGYYHQRQKLYEKADKSKEPAESLAA